jgi:GNAT superfamily N-acetyltransferase
MTSQSAKLSVSMALDTAGLRRVAHALREEYLGFRHAGLHFAGRDLTAEILARHGRRIERHDRPGEIQLSIVADDTGSVVGHAVRELHYRGPSLTVWHRDLRLLDPEWRRRGFGSALLVASEQWYRAAGIDAIIVRAEGDGSRFAALRGFDFDLASYSSYLNMTELSPEQLRLAAVDQLVRHPGIHETVPDNMPVPSRESIQDLVHRVRQLGGTWVALVEQFESRLPTRARKPAQSRVRSQP